MCRFLSLGALPKISKSHEQDNLSTTGLHSMYNDMQVRRTCSLLHQAAVHNWSGPHSCLCGQHSYWGECTAWEPILNLCNCYTASAASIRERQCTAHGFGPLKPFSTWTEVRISNTSSSSQTWHRLDNALSKARPSI